MRAAVCRRLSPDRSGLVIEDDWPAPAPGPDEVGVRVTFAALNYPDLLMLSGAYQYAPPLPFIPGVEGCGVVDALGEGVAASRLGTRVIVGARSGCFAERIVVPEAGIREVPAGLSDAEAAAYSVGALTAFVALARRGRLRPGERVLVAGAGGGMGLAAVAVAAALGAWVVAAASTTAKLAAAQAAGADDLLLIDRNRPDYSRLSEPVDVIFDPVGHSAHLPTALRWGGRYLVIGFVGGIGRVALDDLLLRGIEVVGVRAGEFARQDPAGGRANIAAIDALAAGGLRPQIGMMVPLTEVAQALAAMASGTLIGKAVIDLRDPRLPQRDGVAR